MYLDLIYCRYIILHWCTSRLKISVYFVNFCSVIQYNCMLCFVPYFVLVCVWVSMNLPINNITTPAFKHSPFWWLLICVVWLFISSFFNIVDYKALVLHITSCAVSTLQKMKICCIISGLKCLSLIQRIVRFGYRYLLIISVEIFEHNYATSYIWLGLYNLESTSAGGSNYCVHQY